jgi:hypothetical protein
VINGSQIAAAFELEVAGLFVGAPTNSPYLADNGRTSKDTEESIELTDN